MNFDCADGNFSLQRLNQKNDPDDVSLNDGSAYFVSNEKYKEYVKKVRPEPDVRVILHCIMCATISNFNHSDQPVLIFAPHANKVFLSSKGLLFLV